MRRGIAFKTFLIWSVFLLCYENIFAQFKLSELNTAYALGQLRYNSVWFDADQDLDLDLLNVSIYNQNNQLFLEKDRALEFAISDINNDGGNANGSCMADVDADGDLDIFIYSIFAQRNMLYLQEQAGVFKRDYRSAELLKENNAFYAEFCDIDLDQDPDLIITDTELWNPKTVRKSTRIFLNNGKGVFSKHPIDVFATPLSNTRAVLLFDYNQDLLKDVLLLNFGSASELYINKGNLQFEKVFTNISLEKHDAMAAKSADFDADGDEDVVLATVKDGIYYYRNDGNNLFSILTYFDDLEFGQIEGIEVADYNFDHKPDVLVHSKSEKKIYYLQNIERNTNSFLQLKLRCSKSNYFSIGAKVYVKSNIGWQYKEITKANSVLQKNTYDVYFGLGNSKIIDSIKIVWPDGMIQYFKNILPNETYLITQNSSSQNGNIKILKEEYDYSFREAKLNDLNISLVASPEMKIGENNSLSIFYKNNSAIAQDVEIQLELSESFKLQYTYPMPTKTEDRVLYWKIKDMRANESGIITLNFSLPISADLLYKELLIKANIGNHTLDEFPLDNEVELKRIIK